FWIPYVIGFRKCTWMDFVLTLPLSSHVILRGNLFHFPLFYRLLAMILSLLKRKSLPNLGMLLVSIN
ncbi:alpha amylase, catalytic domain protein, partial [Chlamydia psittaci 84-8471/1]